ncbi:MAG: DNA/RNA nuclease SfsA [Caldimicrobium sp.]|nr:DNA/RNA nuclease SfsA [Caldimicrobium sp.]MCX7874319.1 DNA/RNA nuclease SfsA [Caldimicrobium sp.]MDW8094925.1 DNA/RNA nuclease SfsA [Caldimicrobium sp.]
MELLKAYFLERLNRFVVRVDLRGKVVLAYLPNPGRLWEILLPGTPLLLTKTSGSKYPYTVIASLRDKKLILLHTHLTNKIVKKLICNQQFSPLQDYFVEREEPKTGQGRVDLLLRHRTTQEPFFLEVKTCTLFGSELAMFPDAETERGTRHLYELLHLREKGIRGGLLFVVMNFSCNYFLPAYHIDWNFTKAFLETYSKVDIWAIALSLSEDLTEVRALKELQIPIEYLHWVFKDKGIYILLIEVPEEREIPIGKLGLFFFPRGYYVYVGSAHNSLSQRLKRYQKPIKNQHWHIDYLLPYGKLKHIIPIVTLDRVECTLASKISSLADQGIYKFGSSDCSCFSHLFYFKEYPLRIANFVEIVNFFRLEIPTEQIKSFQKGAYLNK